MKEVVLLEVRSLTRVWVEGRGEQYKTKIRSLVGVLEGRSIQTSTRMKPGSAAGQEVPDIFPLGLCYVAVVGASCSKGYSSSDYDHPSRMTVLRSCRRL